MKKYKYLSTIKELLSYTDYHFKSEEKYMRDAGCKDIDKHIVEHNYFTNEIIFTRRKHENNISNTDSNLIEFMSNWLIQHVTE